MTISSYASELTTQLSQVSPSSIPGTLWAFYLHYLVFYEPDSWVAKISYACRILALLIALPIIILSLLDLASYGIARSLGVVDDVRASTSDKSTIHATNGSRPQPPPMIQVNGIDTPVSESTFSSDSDRDSTSSGHTLHNRMRSPLSTSTVEEDQHDTDAGSQPSLYYVGEGSGKLAGVDVFSPAASMPPSPTISRQSLAFLSNKTDTPTDNNLRHRNPPSGLPPLQEAADN